MLPAICLHFWRFFTTYHNMFAEMPKKCQLSQTLQIHLVRCSVSKVMPGIHGNPRNTAPLFLSVQAMPGALPAAPPTPGYPVLPPARVERSASSVTSNSSSETSGKV